MPVVGTVRHATEQTRYEFVGADGQVMGVADYEPGPGYVVMHHTETAPAFRGNGVAARLVAGALDDLRERGFQIVATCWYVAQFIDDHPQYHDMVAG